jgi:hypothetical protein
MMLGDLVALIAGAGLAAASGWNVLMTGPTTLIPRAVPGWFVVLFYAMQVFEKACEALVPVILVRKIRHATPVWPAEFAALGWGLIVVPATVFNGVPERIAIGAVLLIGGASIFVLARRRRLPGWARGLLVFAAWFAAAAIVSVAYAAAIDALLGDDSAPSSAARAALDWALKTVPNRVLTHAPTAFAVLDLLGRRGRRRTWVEWAALASAVGLWVATDLETLCRLWLGILGPRTPAMQAIFMAIPLVVLVLSFGLGRFLAPLFRRGLGLAEQLVPGSAAAKMESSAPG